MMVAEIALFGIIFVELLRYDFGHCNIDKVCPALFFNSELSFYGMDR